MAEYLEISNKEYRAMEGISSTDLKRMAKSMAHFHYFKENPDNSDSPALLFGRAAHKMILEPYDFDNEFSVIPSCDRRTKEGKEKYENFLKDSEGKDVITKDVYEKIVSMRDALYSTPYCKKLIYGEHEKSFFWNEDGLTMKIRPDSYGKIGTMNIIVDYKTCTCAETETFMRDAIRLNYDLQAAHYKKGMETIYGEEFEFLFIAQEKEPPFAVNILQADEFFMKSGTEVRQSLLEDYKECLERGEWKGYMGFENETEISSLGLPTWMKKMYESEE